MGGLIVWLEELYIEENLQGHGLGSAFLLFLEKEYRHKAAYIRLEVVDENKGAVRLYEKNGYSALSYKQMMKKL